MPHTDVQPHSRSSSTATPRPVSDASGIACVAVRPHLLQFIAWREWLPDLNTPLLVPGIGPIAAALDAVLVPLLEYRHSQSRGSVDEFGARLYYRLAAKEKSAPSDSPRSPQLGLFSAVALDEVAHRAVQRERRFVTDAGMARFNRVVEQLLLDDLARYILREKKLNGRTETDAIYDFLDEVGISELVEFDKAKKGAYRWRVHYNAPIIRGHDLRPRTQPVDVRARVRVKW